MASKKPEKPEYANPATVARFGSAEGAAGTAANLTPSALIPASIISMLSPRGATKSSTTGGTSK